MAGSEGSGQTELLSGWSCVVHRPSEDPEPSELPSTVDMAAFTSGLSVEPAQNNSNEESCDSESDSETDSNNSGSDGSGSCSQSDSSDSETSSSSQETSSRSSSPEFSVTSSQTDGLRLKIATVRKSCTSPGEKPTKSESKPSAPNVKVSDKSDTAATTNPVQGGTTLSSSSDDSHCTEVSSESSSESEARSVNKSDNTVKANDIVEKNVSVKKPVAKIVLKQIDKVDRRATRSSTVTSSPKLGSKSRTRSKRTRKIASLPLSHGSTASSSESEDGSETDRTMLAACSLQEIRQEDLAAILPDQQECDAFGDFDCRDDKDSPHTGDGSGSDMELPQQAVNALILRTTESSSESESRLPPNPSTLYANSFLQQFVAQTQLLNISTTPTVTSETSLPNITQLTDNNSTPTSDLSPVKRKRGRPKKNSSLKLQTVDYKSEKSETNIEYCGNPNVSPDSGIQNSSDHVSSPEPSPIPNPKTKYIKDEAAALNNINARVQGSTTSNCFDTENYGISNRVLYPLRKKVGRPVVRKGPGRPPKHKSLSSNLQETNPYDIDAEIRAEINNKTKGISLKSDKISKFRNHKNVPEHSINLEGKPKTKDVQKKSKAHLLQVCDKVRQLEYPQSIENGKIQRKSIKKVNNNTLGSSKNKAECLKTKFATLNSKVMHSKHKEKRHKKCKFKILKPLTSTYVDSKINTEIDKLVLDFVKLCNISVAKPLKENVPEVLKTIKKVSKKRKTSEYNERKKKKQSVSNSFNKETNSNEQRLPLKKRHYHLSTSNEIGSINLEQSIESITDIKNCNSNIPKTIEKPKIVTRAISVPEQKVETATYSKSTSLNNNDYTTTCKPKSAKVDVHIEEAIEACITKYSLVPEPTTKSIRSPKPMKAEALKLTKSELLKSNKVETEPLEIVPVKEEEKNTTVSSSLNTTTPKKRHRLELKNNAEVASITDIIEASTKTSLETVVSELKARKPATPTIHEKKHDNAAHVITRKKNRLEDLTLSLANKVNSNLLDESTVETNNQKRKKDELLSSSSKKPKSDLLNLDSVITSDEPTGIFMPTVDIELDLPSCATPVVDLSKVKVEDLPVTTVESTSIKDPPLPLIKTEVGSSPIEHSPRRRVRKRRAINRTGFPSVKKKKKRIVTTEAFLQVPEGIPQTIAKVEERAICDRVPQEGEKYSTFLQRTEKTNVADTILEKLQKCIVSTPNLTEQQIAKWNEEESMYELGFLRNGRPSSRSSMKECRSKDVSPSISIETRSSDKRSEAELDEHNLEYRLKGSESKTNMRIRSLRNSSLQKRRLREISPASSSEPCSEKRLREVSVSGDESKRTRKTSKWKKTFLVAGLFSDYYKEDVETARIRRESIPKRLTYKPEEHPFGLLPPPFHCGKFIRCRKIPFRLPYDLWWQHTNSQLAGHDIVPSWNYRKIRTNIYNVKNNGGACEPQACNCTTESGCGDDCINRLVLAECPATHKCQNQRIQKHDWAPGIEKFMTVDKGWGVRAKLPIKCSEFILEYVGEVVSDNEFKERMASRYAHDIHHYCLHLDGGLVIDGHRMGGHGRFVNHSCDPNCEIQKWSVNGQFRMALFALRDIESEEELTYDYNFSLFNPAEGQECKCGSNNCRGVIGGKTQRVVRQSIVSTPVPSLPVTTAFTPGRKGRPRKKKIKAKCDTSLIKEPSPPTAPAFVPPPIHASAAPALLIKPLNNVQRSYVREHCCFLLRNLNKSKQHRVSINRPNPVAPVENSATFVENINSGRKSQNVKTRRIARVEDDPDHKKAAKLAGSLKDLLNVVTLAKDEKNELLCSPFIILPSKRKLPDYYHSITEPMDLTTIEKTVTDGNYFSIENFDSDVNKIFSNAVKYYGRTSDLGIAAVRLRKIYCEAKKKNVTKLEEELGEKMPVNFIPTRRKGDEEDVIRCICGMYHDEGLMIQCERCLVWQHSECVRADAKTPSFHCERCVPRKVDYEISLDEFTEHGHRYYLTLMRGDLQLRQSDTVYVLRDITIPGTKKKHTYKTIGEIRYADLDIFRIERLWKDSKTGQRFAYGHHYLRPHETFHEPTRKFFPNEVMRVPLYEAVPVELVISRCWVFDINTYCKGRPICAPEEHIYICEYRVDKTAHLFMKNSKAKYPICTKSYAFQKFDVRLKISRTYAPHDLDPALVKPRGRKAQESDNVKDLPQLPVHVPPVIRTLSEKKQRLNKILLSLLTKMPTKQALNVSYLLESGRRRKKPPVEK